MIAPLMPDLSAYPEEARVAGLAAVDKRGGLALNQAWLLVSDVLAAGWPAMRARAAGAERDRVRAELAAVATIPDGMTPEKLEKIADYVGLLDRMDIDLDARTVTFRQQPRMGESGMQDDLRAWAVHLRDGTAGNGDGSGTGKCCTMLDDPAGTCGCGPGCSCGCPGCRCPAPERTRE